MGKYNAYPKEIEDFVRENAEGKRIKEIAEITLMKREWALL